MEKRTKLHCPGAFGEIGGYPVIIDGSGGESPQAYIDKNCFSLDEMRRRKIGNLFIWTELRISRMVFLPATDELLHKK